jgi:hypothetical protein
MPERPARVAADRPGYPRIFALNNEGGPQKGFYN